MSGDIQGLTRTPNYAAIMKRFDTNLTCPWISPLPDLLQKFTDHTRCCGAPLFVTTMEFGQNIFCNRSALGKRVTALEKQLLAMAEAMPADKYSFAPTNAEFHGEFRGVRNFAKQLKRLAAFHYVVGAAILGKAPPADAADERGPEEAKTKAEVTKYLQDSLAYLHKPVATINEKNLVAPIKSPFGQGTITRLEWVMGAIAHSSNHYGQMVEYLRMNSIIPPGSS